MKFGHRIDVAADVTHVEHVRRGGSESAVHPALEQLQRGVTGDDGVPGRTPLGRIGERFDVGAVRQVERAWTCGHSSSPGHSRPEVERPTRNGRTATVRSS